MGMKQDRLEVKLDDRFDQLINCIKDLGKAPEQREKKKCIF